MVADEQWLLHMLTLSVLFIQFLRATAQAYPGPRVQSTGSCSSQTCFASIATCGTRKFALELVLHFRHLVSQASRKSGKRLAQMLTLA